MPVFADRAEAGRRLAGELQHLPWPDGRGPQDVVGVSGGGVAVAFEVARHLGLPLDLIAVRKITVPGSPDQCAGAVAEGVLVDREGFLRRFAQGQEAELLPELAREAAQWVADRAAWLRGRHPAAALRGRHVLLVDDAVITGATMQAAATAVRLRGAAAVVLAVPAASPAALHRLGPLVDKAVCLHMAPARALDAWYADCRPVSDEQTMRLLAASRRPQAR